MAGIPSGTVTFLFTDIEGSTKLAQAHPEMWEMLRERHHDILRSAIETHDGYVFQIIGDAFCAAFHTVKDGLNAALHAQRRLQNEDWGETPIKVRMGLHTGAAEFRGSDYRGYLTMARVQRVMSTAYGGQILLSNASAELMRGELPESVALRDMKENRLKGLLNPEHLWQVVTADLPQDFPPLATLNSIPNNLPIQLTSFVGRGKKIAEVEEELNNHRLVTLTGAGGTGKTRLSLQVAAEVLNQYPNGVWFVELATLMDPALIPQAMLSVIGIAEKFGKAPIEVLKEYLQEKFILIVLDNCEHLIEASAEIVNTLLNAAPNLTVLASSREALGVQGEASYPVPSLSLPDPKHLPKLEQLSQYEAVQLFIDRALLVQPHFAVTSQNAPDVAQICHRLDGIPLAIELAAARVKALSVEKIAERLDDRFRLLTGGARTALPRQQTLRATIDWSYDLLSEQEQVLLRSLAVFSGGWRLEAAEQVSIEEGNEWDTLELITRLVDKSLVNMYVSSGETRYQMLETTRQYALEKLIQSGEDQIARNYHFAYFLQLAENAESQLIGPDQAQWLNHLEREHDNFRTALEWSIKERKGEEALQMVGALGLFWLKHAHFSEGRRWLGNILGDNWSTSDQARVKAWRWAGCMALAQQDAVETRRIFTQNLEREQALGDQWGIAFSLHMLANTYDVEGDVEKVRELHTKSIALSREIDAIWVLALAQFSLGYSEQAQGNLALAEELYEESLNHSRRLGEKWAMHMVLSNLGFMMCSKGDLLAAKRIFLEALDLSKELGNKDGMSTVLIGIAGVLETEGEYIASAKLQGAAISIEREIGFGHSMSPVEQEFFDSTAKALKEAMGVQVYQMEFEAGTALTLDEIISLASGHALV